MQFGNLIVMITYIKQRLSFQETRASRPIKTACIQNKFSLSSLGPKCGHREWNCSLSNYYHAHSRAVSRDGSLSRLLGTTQNKLYASNVIISSLISRVGIVDFFPDFGVFQAVWDIPTKFFCRVNFPFVKLSDSDSNRGVEWDKRKLFL